MSAEDDNKLTAASALAAMVLPTDSCRRKAEKSRRTDDDDEEDDDKSEDGKGFNIPQKYTKSGRKRAVPFPLKLMKVLSCGDYQHIIDWMPSGKSFTIKKPKQFTSDVLPSHFKTAKYSSFTRKLHRWGFMRHYRGNEAGAFFHNDFQKDRLDLVENMTCYKTDCPKPSSGSESDNPHQENLENGNESREAISGAGVLAEDSVFRPTLRNNFSQFSHQQTFPGTGLLNRNVERVLESARPPALAMDRAPFSSYDVSSGNTMMPSVNTLTGDLNAAIEAEVARRVNERIKAAAMARDALALLQQQVKPLQTLPSVSTIQNHMLNRNQLSLGGTNQLFPGQRGVHNVDHRAALTLAAAQNFYKFRPINFAALQRNNSLPATNIQGAKTA